MKLSTVLKNVIATKYEITDRTNNIDYHINYLRGGFKVDDFGSFQYHTTPVSLPKELFKRDVKYIDINSVTNELVITLK